MAQAQAKVESMATPGPSTPVAHAPFSPMAPCESFVDTGDFSSFDKAFKSTLRPLQSARSERILPERSVSQASAPATRFQEARCALMAGRRRLRRPPHPPRAR